jgi:hypothetical protein
VLSAPANSLIPLGEVHAAFLSITRALAAHAPSDLPSGNPIHYSLGIDLSAAKPIWTNNRHGRHVLRIAMRLTRRAIWNRKASPRTGVNQQ